MLTANPITTKRRRDSQATYGHADLLTWRDLAGLDDALVHRGPISLPRNHLAGSLYREGARRRFDLFFFYPLRGGARDAWGPATPPGSH